MIQELCTVLHFAGIFIILYVLSLLYSKELHAQTELNSSEVEYPSYKN